MRGLGAVVSAALLQVSVTAVAAVPVGMPVGKAALAATSAAMVLRADRAVVKTSRLVSP